MFSDCIALVCFKFAPHCLLLSEDGIQCRFFFHSSVPDGVLADHTERGVGALATSVDIVAPCICNTAVGGGDKTNYGITTLPSKTIGKIGIHALKHELSEVLVTSVTFRYRCH